MNASVNYLAIDLGASSGRAMLGAFDGERVSLRELHRFPNGPVTLQDGLYWDAPRLLGEVRRALTLCAKGSIALSGVGIDTWGVDYALLSPAGEPLGLPRHYRDPRTRGMIDAAARIVPREEMYRATGIQFMEINTLFQLLADQRDDPRRLNGADRLLFVSGLLNFWLTGEKSAEVSIASTSQMFDPRAGVWAGPMLERFGLPVRVLPDVVPSGTVVGPLRRVLVEEWGVPATPVVAPACHDTACAVAATPGAGEDWAYISCGTWSLVGAELDAPICTPEAMRANFTNEIGVGGTVRFLKNIPGLWLLQECKRAWDVQGRAYEYAQFGTMAASAPALRCLIDPDDPSLAGFGDMPALIRAAAARFGPAPQSDAEVVRCILESLAIKHRLVIDELERLTGRTVRLIHMVGGGARDSLLCQWTANATGRRVLAGPVEATALGNVLLQAVACGRLRCREQIRTVVRASSETVVYAPCDPAPWQAAIGRLCRAETSQ